MMSKFLLIMLTCFAIIGLYGQTPNWLWAKSAGGNNSEEGYSVTYDSDGNQYVTGYFCNTAVFDNIVLTSNGSTDIFVAKLNSAGNWIWVIQAGSTSNVGIESGTSIVADNAGNLYITGYFNETATFGTTTLTSVGAADIFAAKLTGNGDWLWAQRAGGIEYDNGLSLSLDNIGNVLVCGVFQDTADFGSTILTGSGATDIFTAKLDSAGNWLWANKAGGQYSDVDYSISCDSNGSCYITGNYALNIMFGLIELTSTNFNDSNTFVAKLDSEGNWLWAKKAGGISYDRGYGIVVDDNGNSYIVGFYYDIGIFGPYILTNNNFAMGDIFVAKLDTEGNWLWAKSAGGTNDDYGYSIDLDAYGNIYVAGMFKGLALFGTIPLISNGNADIFAAKLDANGNWLWAKSAGGNADDRCLSINVNDSDYPCLTGYFTNSVVFGDTTLSSYSVDDSDIFIAKLDASYTEISDLLNPVIPFTLKNNFPNPFKSFTTISYQLKTNNFVRIEIYNIKGQLISTLVNETEKSGNHRVIWNGTDANGSILSAGVYLCKMMAGNYSSSRKMILLN